MSPKFLPLAQLFCERSAGAWRDPAFLDSGGSAEVYELVGSSGRAALKVYDPAFFEGEQGLAEVERIRRQCDLVGVRHPHLVEILDADELVGEGTWTVLMEFVPPPNLEKGLGTVTRAMIRPLLQQLVSVARFLEERPRPLYHRDIKPANIAFDAAAASIKMLDLGVVRCPLPGEFVSDPPGTKRFLATVQYSSPEYLIRDDSWGNEREQLQALTFYQIGAVLHDLIMQRPMFGEVVATKNKALLVEAVRNQLPKIVAPDVDADLIELANACLTKDPCLRLQRVSWDRFAGERDDPKVALANLVARRSAGMVENTENTAFLRLQRISQQVFEIALDALQQNRDAFGPCSMQKHEAPGSRSATFSLSGMLSDDAEVRITVTAAPAVGSSEIYEVFVDAALTSAKCVPEPAFGVPLTVIHGGSVEDCRALCDLFVDRFALLYTGALARCDAYKGSPIIITD